MAQSGDIFVLDMGEPVRILDLARDFLRLQGVHESRARIEFTGIRPGEKLHEQLFDVGENAMRTSHSKVFRVRSTQGPMVDARAVAEHLIELARAGSNEEVRAQLMAAVGGPAKPRMPAVTRRQPKPARVLGSASNSAQI
jgi:FlaA1/EpsC-like NDP-sugar epimerase